MAMPNARSYPFAVPAPSVITIGNFDGVHLGHQAILRAARAVGDEHGWPIRAVTFDPHPRAILRPDDRTPLLLPVDQRVQRLRDAGADDVVVLRPTHELLATEPEQFIQHLRREHDAAVFVEGYNFRFGKFRRGDVDLLRKVGGEQRFDVVVVDPQETALLNQHAARVSSSLVRWLLACGRVADAARCLGRPHELRARVVKGEQRGRSIGVPTINLSSDDLKSLCLPADGVYAATATLPGADAYPAAVSIGIKPTFGRRAHIVEAHLLDFEGDLYDKTVTLALHRWLRDQQPFPSVDDLKAQLHRDIIAVRRDDAHRQPPAAVSS